MNSPWAKAPSVLGWHHGAAKVEQLHHQWEAEEEVVEEEQKRLEDLMRLYGLEEKEARAAYHLGLAEELFEDLRGSLPEGRVPGRSRGPRVDAR